MAKYDKTKKAKILVAIKRRPWFEDDAMFGLKNKRKNGIYYSNFLYET